MKQPTNQTAFLAVIAIFSVPFIFLMIVSALINNPAGKGAIPFQNIEGTFRLEDTSYVLVYADHNLVLRNRFTGKSVDIVQGYSPVASPPAYALVRTAPYQIYLITRLASGGNTGASWYRVFDLVQWPMVELTSETADSENGLSCVDPRLDEHRFPNVLMFERSANCAYSPSSYQKYVIPLH